MKLAILFALLLCAVFAAGAPAGTQAPDVTVNDFFAYLLAAKRGISTGTKSQVDTQCHKSQFSEAGTLRKDLRELAVQKQLVRSAFLEPRGED